jgi:hypothetical protein
MLNGSSGNTMTKQKHTIIPGKGTDLIQHGMTLEEVVSKIGMYDKCYKQPNPLNSYVDYTWSKQDVQLRFLRMSTQVNCILFHTKSNLYLDNVPVFSVPNHVVLFGMHDAYPIEVADKVIFTNLCIQVENPLFQNGYSSMHTGSGSLFYVSLLSFEQSEQMRQHTPAYPEYDWKIWLKQTLNTSD